MRYHGVVGEHHPEKGMGVFFDSAPDEDAMWVQEEGEDEWEWECATVSEVATSRAQWPGVAHPEHEHVSKAPRKSRAKARGAPAATVCGQPTRTTSSSTL